MTARLSRRKLTIQPDRQREESFVELLGCSHVSRLVSLVFGRRVARLDRPSVVLLSWVVYAEEDRSARLIPIHEKESLP